MSRDALIALFLARHGFACAHAAPLAQDASFRRYLRLTGGPRPAVLMDAPPPEDVRPFLRIATHLSGIGLSAPEIIAADAVNGLVLEEDLGDPLPAPPGEREWAAVRVPPAAPSPPALPPKAGEAILPPGVGEGALYPAAVDALVALQRAAPPPDLPAWDATSMAQTALETLLDWWWPAAFGAPPPPAARDDFAAALAAMLRPLIAGPRCCVHRDYFAGNLIWLPDRAGPRRIGVIDFQGAALGHPAYDLASLLQDARRDMPQPLADQAIARYLAARPELDPAPFLAAYAICAAQRHLRVACQWVRLALRDDRPHYLAHGPRTWRLLGTALRQPNAAPLAAAMDRWIPPDQRANPRGLAA
jgi:aminoglycoside/choline kinase family phosphotransferase